MYLAFNQHAIISEVYKLYSTGWCNKNIKLAVDIMDKYGWIWT